jgi:dihydropteroate synthase
MINLGCSFPKIMGILNVTPDSFSDGAFYFDTQMAINHALEMIDEGADIIDIGGESTRPGSDSVDLEEEIQRVIPIVSEIKQLRPNIKISVDTTKYEVAKQALDLGANIINDVSSFSIDERLCELVKQYNAGLVIMHSKGKPKTMQINPVYDDLIADIKCFLSEKVKFAKEVGLKDIWIDVGIGFGKTPQDNLNLLKNLDVFSDLGVKQLLGISRKSFIGKLLDIEHPLDRDLPTLLLHTILLNCNIDIIRVHSIKEYELLRKIHKMLS